MGGAASDHRVESPVVAVNGIIDAAGLRFQDRIHEGWRWFLFLSFCYSWIFSDCASDRPWETSTGG